MTIINEITLKCIIDGKDINVEVIPNDMVFITTLPLEEMDRILLSSPDDDFKTLQSLEDSNDIVEFDLSDGIAYYRHYYLKYNPEGAELIAILDSIFKGLGIELVDDDWGD